METRLQVTTRLFEFGMSIVMQRWSVLKMAVENGWGGGDSQRKAFLFGQELSSAFTSKASIPDVLDVEDFLCEYLEDHFSTVSEDGSCGEVCASCP